MLLEWPYPTIPTATGHGRGLQEAGMTDHRGRRVAPIAVLMACVAVLAGTFSASAANHPPPANDLFAGRVAGTSGRLAGYRGSATIALDPRQGTTTRRLTITVTGRSCAGIPRCLRLTGTLSGTIQRQSAQPDRGQAFAISVRGDVAPLGTVSATGGCDGTGFVRQGRESVRLTLVSRNGRVAVTAESGLVPGFTSP